MKPTTIEQTSKRYKAIQFAGVALMIASIVGCAVLSTSGGSGVAVAAGTTTFLVGASIYVAGRFAAWWHHG